MDNMKFREPIYFSMLLCVGMTVGCRDSKNQSPDRVTLVHSTPAVVETNQPMEQLLPPSQSAAPEDPAWDYKTVDKEMSEIELRQQMQEWSREGWAVVSISKSLTQADGTTHRRVKLRKAKR